MPGESATDRTVIAVSGEERFDFLQGLVTNDVARARDGLVYAAFLSPQGKYLADFFLLAQDSAILIDVKTDLSDAFLRRLSMYKLRAKVGLEPSALNVSRGIGPVPEGALTDPRHPSLGWRLYSAEAGGPPSVHWDALRVAACIPETGIELIPDQSYILEMGFERLNGVDFHKGCYVGQEVTARMKHKTDLRKGLAQVEVDGAAPVGTEIVAGGKAAGTLYTQAEGQGLAYLRFDRAGPDMQAGDATLCYRG